MIEIKAADGQYQIEVQGKAEEVAAELASAISHIWASYVRHNMRKAEIFEMLMKALMCDPQSPTFTMRDEPGRLEIILPKK